MISWPVVVSPVKATLPIPGCPAIAAPAEPPGPVTTLMTPGGKPASSASWPTRSAVIGERLAGLRMQVLPAARAGPSFQLAISSGKFQGTISPTTPIGSRSVMAMPGIDGLAPDDHLQSGDLGCGGLLDGLLNGHRTEPRLAARRDESNAGRMRMTAPADHTLASRDSRAAVSPRLARAREEHVPRMPI